MSGTIQLLNYDNNLEESWSVETECDLVHIQSEMFKTEKNFDYVVIGESRISGENQWRTNGEPMANQWRTIGEPLANHWRTIWRNLANH